MADGDRLIHQHYRSLMRIFAFTSFPALSALTILLAGSGQTIAQIAPGYTLEALPVGSAGGAAGSVHALSDAGLVVGERDAGGAFHAFVFTDGGILDLGTLGGTHSAALDVSPSGIIVGRSDLRFPGVVRAFLFDAGVMRDIGTLPDAVEMVALGVNDAGDVVGRALVATGADESTRAFLLRDGELVELGTLGGEGASAVAVNPAGHIVGWSLDASGRTRAFRWSAESGMADLGTLGGAESRAAGINSAGVIVGEAETALGVAHACVWAEGETIDLGTLGGLRSAAAAVNDAGVVVGGSQIGSGIDQHAFIRVAGGRLTDLNELMRPGTPWVLSSARDINNAGQVLVEGFRLTAGRFESAAFILHPVEEDADGDGVPFVMDNCDGLANADQADRDGDLLGDACDGCPADPAKSAPGLCGCGVKDEDLDEDGVADCDDNCPDLSNPTQADADGDGIGDACEPPPPTGSPFPCGAGLMWPVTLVLVTGLTAWGRRSSSRRLAI